MNSKPKQLPPRWLNCPRKGDLIDKFLPFKTPLCDDYDELIPEEHRFPPSMLISALKSRKLKMGLWIDLTNTTRFYDCKDIERLGIRYMKLACKGRDECPTPEQTDVFIRECHKFILSNPLDIIGVHCTHGFNRTGFLIAAYMIRIHDYSVDAAAHEFRKAREPGMYKADYLTELAVRFGDASDIPPTPPRPDWCNEYDDRGVDDDGISLKDNDNHGIRGKNGGSPMKKRKREFLKKNPVFMEGVKGVVPITQQPKLQQIQNLCQEMCEWQGTGFPGSQPVSMDTNNILYLSQKPYKVSWKADGTRYMMLINGEDAVYFIDRDNAVYKVSGLTFPRRKFPDEHLYGTLLDGEMIIDKVNERDHPRYLIYDIIKFENQDVGKTDFDRRMLCISKEIVDVRNTAIVEGRLNKTLEPFSIRKKEFWDIASTKSLLAPKFTSLVGHEIDGLIFQPVTDKYVCNQSPFVLKWKPPNLNSVDFKLVITVENRIGFLKSSVGNLFVGGLDQPFATIKVTKELRNYDKKIIECKFESNQWMFMRERTDKSFPNSYNTARAVCQSIKDPVTEDRLVCYIDAYKWMPNRKRERDDFAVPSEPPKKRAS